MLTKLFQFVCCLVIVIHVNCDTNKFRIHKNELTSEEQTFIFTNILLAMNEYGTCQYGLIADKMAEQLNNKYGSNDWFCLCGKQLIEPNFNTCPKSFIWLSYEETQIMIFKPLGITELDMIFESRLRTTVTLIDSEMDPKQQEQTLAITSLAICKNNDFETIAQNISDSLNLKYGHYWRCIVSTSNNQNNELDSTIHAYKSLLSFKIGEIMFTIYKTNHPQFKTCFDDVISRARNEEVRIMSSDSMESDIELKVIENAKQVINNCHNNINMNNGYEWIARALQDNLNVILKCTCDCRLSVVVGLKYFYGTHSQQYKSLLRFNFGQLFITVAKF